ncbi:MAG: hypothetical protein GF331_02940 [Chitinivibrionales bacterium]|nr:hypothetical protein [Chitinivibrionales bacterium]
MPYRIISGSASIPMHIHFLHKRSQITNVLDFISAGRMPVRVLSPYKIALSIWENEQEAVIVLFNISFQHAEEVSLDVRYRGTASELNLDGAWTECGTLAEGRYKVRDVRPWSVRVVKVTFVQK